MCTECFYPEEQQTLQSERVVVESYYEVLYGPVDHYIIGEDGYVQLLLHNIITLLSFRKKDYYGTIIIPNKMIKNCEIVCFDIHLHFIIVCLTILMGLSAI